MCACRAASEETETEGWRRGRLTGELLANMRLFMASHRHKDGELLRWMCTLCGSLTVVVEEGKSGSMMVRVRREGGQGKGQCAAGWVAD